MAVEIIIGYILHTLLSGFSSISPFPCFALRLLTISYLRMCLMSVAREMTVMSSVCGKCDIFEKRHAIVRT